MASLMCHSPMSENVMALLGKMAGEARAKEQEERAYQELMSLMDQNEDALRQLIAKTTNTKPHATHNPKWG